MFSAASLAGEKIATSAGFKLRWRGSSLWSADPGSKSNFIPIPNNDLLDC